MTSETIAENLFATLEAAELAEAPEDFSVLPAHQLIPAAVLSQIGRFIGVFEQVTSRETWRAAALRKAPSIARQERWEVCFFSAWDFHLPPEGGCRLIEFNDNGSGFLFAAAINAGYYDAAALVREKSIVAPTRLEAFEQYICELVERERRALFGTSPSGLILILDDSSSLSHGRFRGELRLLRRLFERRGWTADIGCPMETRWDGERLLFKERPVSVVVNRSTDFFWRGDEFASLRQAYELGHVHIAPNPFSYATRSDKRLLEWLSQPHWDAELGIVPEERRILSAHVPETHVIRADNLQALAEHKNDFAFKPFHGYGGRGLLAREVVGRARLRRLSRDEESYVAQRWVEKPRIEIDGTSLWTDLRVWAYRGDIYLLSGRASRRPDRLELTPPGGWLATYACLTEKARPQLEQRPQPRASV